MIISSGPSKPKPLNRLPSCPCSPNPSRFSRSPAHVHVLFHPTILPKLPGNCWRRKAPLENSVGMETGLLTELEEILPMQPNPSRHPC